MKTIITSLVLLLFATEFIFAQNSSLTVFSQDGEKFFVILDGVRQNDFPNTNVKITDLDRPNYRVKIIFDNAKLEDIDKNVFLQDVDGNAVDVVYSIRPNRKGVLDMRISSFNEAQSAPVAKEENVVKYHTQENPIQEQQTTTTTVTTTTTNGGTTKESVNMNLGVSGTGVNATVTDENGETINVNMNIGDMMRMDGGTTTTTKKVTTTSSTNINTAAPAPVKEKGCTVAMSSSDFNVAKASVNKQSFSDSKMKTAKQFTKANCLSVNQIKEIMNLFSFDDDKLEYAKYAYDYCVDKNKYFMLAEEFSFSSSSDSLNDYIDGK